MESKQTPREPLLLYTDPCVCFACSCCRKIIVPRTTAILKCSFCSFMNIAPFIQCHFSRPPSSCVCSLVDVLLPQLHELIHLISFLCLNIATLAHDPSPFPFPTPPIVPRCGDFPALQRSPPAAQQPVLLEALGDVSPLQLAQNHRMS